MADVFAELARQPEVRDFDLPRLGQQDVLGLQISVKDIVAMQVLDRHEDLYEQEHDGRLGEHSVRFDSALDLAVQIAAVDVLQNEEVLVGLRELVDEPDDVRMRQVGQDVRLVLHSLAEDLSGDGGQAKSDATRRRGGSCFRPNDVRVVIIIIVVVIIIIVIVVIIIIIVIRICRVRRKLGLVAAS